MTIEQKAKAYDNIIEKANKMHCENCEACQMCIEELIPELKESKDEKIRKEILNYLYDVHDDDEERARWIAWLEKQAEHANFLSKIQVGDKVTRNEDGVLVNLSQLNRIAKKDEKQGEQKPYTSETMNEKRNFDKGFSRMMENEQKPADKIEPMSLDEAIEHCKEKSCGNNVCALEHKQLEKWLTELKELKEKKNAWSEEDEEMLKMVIKLCEQCGNEYAYYWLKSLKDRVQPQPKQEWSKEDIVAIDSTVKVLSKNFPSLAASIERLKSLRPQSQWKPDSSMLICLEYAIKHINKDGDKRILSKLLEQLKKLKE